MRSNSHYILLTLQAVRTELYEQMAETILVVDDDMDILELLKMSLESDGFKVRTASDGYSVLQSARMDPPDLILLDVMMPQKDGFQVIQELKEEEETQAIPVILLTARGQTEDKVRGLDTGADDYITKPFDLREVTARIEAVLGRTRPIKYINPLMRTMGDGFSEEGVQQLAGHLRTAAAIQKKLLPEKVPSLQGYDIAALLQSSTSVSGDFYDFIPLSETQLGIVLGDVKGNGIPAALLMVMIRTALRLLCQEEPSPASVLKRINDLLVRDTDVDLFATMIYGILDTEASTFTYSNGGHCYPLHRKNLTPSSPARARCYMNDSENPQLDDFKNTKVSGERTNINFLKTGGMLVGAFDEAEFASETSFLEHGDILLFYTDGITETEVMYGSQPIATSEAIFYGEERLIACLSENATGTAKALCQTVVSDLALFSGSTQPHDDRALVVIRRES